jgi:dienelactone hydrolase
VPRIRAFALAVALVAAVISSAAGKVLTVKIPWNGDYPHNSDKLYSPEWTFGWSKNFLNGAPEEHGKVQKDGTLDAQVYLPKGEGPFAFAILLHGCAGLDKNTRKWADEYVKFLNDRGVGALVLDSFGPRLVAESCGAKGDAHWARRRSEDAYSALDWLVANGHAKTEAVYLIGRSNGGRATLMAMESIVGRDHANHFAAGIAMVPSCEGKAEAKFYAPLIILAAAHDDANPSFKCEAMAKHERPNQPPVTLIVYQSAFHGYMDHVPLHRFHGWRLGYDEKAARDTLKIIASTLAGDKIESKIEYR